MSQVFNVVRVIKQSNFKRYEEFAKRQQTIHFTERNERVKKYSELRLLDIDFLYGFIVDKNHPNGDEMHFINPNGIIYVMNCRSGKLITVLGARPGQIKRYFEALEIKVDNQVQRLLNTAFSHYNNGINYL